MNPPGLDLAALHRYFEQHVPDYGGRLDAQLLAGGKSNLTYRLRDGVHDWVLRRPPLGTLTPSAHDMAREYRVVAALGPTPVPVAPAVLLCEDTAVLGVPFAVTAFVAGRVIQSAADATLLNPDEQRLCGFELIDRLCQLHAIDPSNVGLDNFGRAAGYLERQIRRWTDQWERVHTRDLAEPVELAGRLRLALPARSDRSIVHGDFRLDNVILAPDRIEVAAIVDWEMCTLGDPLADLGLALVYWDPLTEPVLGVPHIRRDTANHFPNAEALVERYSRQSGRELGELDFYVALGFFKLAVIAEGIHQRYRAGLTVGDGFATTGDAVLPLLRAGIERLAP
ncbi:phosphotransferase family protein [Nannocystis bainbridge]|uniref:Phosphotransferase family protein n=1 Tax=Nannocystis bainbridge TaxID=2995303 RepID=A0ABT5E6J9_9BACT|nr:phosphotransferase family protein [Nannocystis bainbridge]MDC0721478.1 phosphotransferase family protein [Nannocystis bainbridge]